MRIGIFGGTFDPIHLAHLIIGEQAREQGRLDQVWFVPSARPPHKLDQAITSFDRRAAMVQLAIAGRADFKLESIEKARPGPSYTADTLRDLRAVYPDDDFLLILGGDSLVDLHHWYEPVRIVEQAEILAASRPGQPMLSAEELTATLPGHPAVRMQRIDVPLLDIASRDLRARVAAGRSIQYLVPRAVEVFIREKKLYKTPA